MSLPTLSRTLLYHRPHTRIPLSPLPFVRYTARSFRTSARRFQQPSGPTPKSSRLPIFPLIFIFAGGTYLFTQLVKARADPMPAIEPQKTTPAGGLPAGSLSAPARAQPLLSQSDATVVFVLGGPGAGKGTQSAYLVRDYGFAHLSAGDLLRAEQDRPGSEFGALIRDCIRDGAIVPMEVTVQLLENAMREGIEKAKEGGGQGTRQFLVDGFPRKMDQARRFEEAVCKSRFTLFFECHEEELQRRLIERGKTSGRADDNAESIAKRFRTFIETSMPVVEAYEKEGRVVKIDAARPPEVVYADVRERLKAWGIEPSK